LLSASKVEYGVEILGQHKLFLNLFIMICFLSLIRIRNHQILNVTIITKDTTFSSLATKQKIA